MKVLTVVVAVATGVQAVAAVLAYFKG